MWELLRNLDQEAVAQVMVPVIAGGFALLSWWLQHRQSKQIDVKLERRIGTPNGQGTVVEMAEKSLDRQDRTLERIADLERIVLGGQSEQDKRIARLERADVDHERQLIHHEHRLSVLEAVAHTD